MTDSALATLAVAWNGAGSAYAHGRTQRCTSKTQESAREARACPLSRCPTPLHSTCSLFSFDVWVRFVCCVSESKFPVSFRVYRLAMALRKAVALAVPSLQKGRFLPA